MRLIFLFCSCILSFWATAQTNIQTELKSLQSSHQYTALFALNQQNKNADRYYFDAVYYNACNQPTKSLQLLERLLKKEASYAQSYEYWKLRNDNEVKLFAYQAAYESSTKLIEQFTASMTEEELEDERNNVLIWKSLAGQAPQRFARYSSVVVPMKRDLAKLMTVPVTMNGVKKDFVFDTGAGLSCITESLAKEMNLTTLPDYGAQVKSFTGVSNHAKVAIAPEVKIGDFTVYNTPFLVYPDNAFTFSGGKYVIHGIIGFPVAKKVGSITFEKDQITFDAEAKTSTEKNLFIEHLRPVLMLSYKGQLLPFNLDTGANHSKFSKAFYDRFKAEMQNAEEVTSQASGAGGQIKTTSYLALKNQVLQLGKQQIILPRMDINKEEYDVYGPYNYGNIGQDVYAQFSKLIISFQYNYLQVQP